MCLLLADLGGPRPKARRMKREAGYSFQEGLLWKGGSPGPRKECLCEGNCSLISAASRRNIVANMVGLVPRRRRDGCSFPFIQSRSVPRASLTEEQTAPRGTRLP